MPYSIPSYSTPFFLRNGHLGTLWPYFFRNAVPLPFKRTTLHTPDHDFLHLEQLTNGHTRCALLIHGLEGSAHSTYITSLAKILIEEGWDVAALQFRGCSGTPNKLFRSYNSGITEDIELTVDHLKASYPTVALIGFSLGGNVVLKYLGDLAGATPKELKVGIGVSVPCHLSSASDKMEDFQNLVYSKKQFVASLKKKLKEKMESFPGEISQRDFERIRTIRQLDDVYTAPANGFKNAEDYYTKCSSLFVLEKICIPTLLINAKDDPFLSPLCFPKKIAEANQQLHFYHPSYGGHVGFWPEKNSRLWKHEEWIIEFLRTI